MIKYSGIYESSTPPPSTKALWVDGGVLKIYKNGSWRPVDDPKSKLNIDSILKAGSTNPVENRAIHSRFIGVDKDIEVNRNNIGVLTDRVDKVDGLAKGTEALTKINEERISAVTRTADTALTNSWENQDSVRRAQVTANEAKASVEGLTTVTKRIEDDVSQLKELNVVYPNNIRNLTTESTVREISNAFQPVIPIIEAVTIVFPHVGYLIKGNENSDSQNDPDSTIISVEIVKIDNKDCHKFMYIDNNRDLVTMTVYLAGLTDCKVIERSVVSNINTIVDKINTFDKKLSSGTLRDLYISAGAKYNEATGFYELNGLTDITEEEMRKIYRYAGTPQVKASHAYSQIRTNFPSPGFCNGSICEGMFYESKIEVINLGYKQTQPPTILKPYVSLEGQNAFYLCKNLRIIYGRIENYHTINDLDFTFGECAKLEEVRIYRLGTNIKFSWSPNLSKESVLYMITNANPPSGAAAGSIAITLHPTAYARLKDDADIVAALEAKGGIITVVSA